MQNRILHTLLFLLLTLTAIAGKIDTVSVDSPSMHRAVNCLIVVPDKRATAPAERFSVNLSAPRLWW